MDEEGIPYDRSSFVSAYYTDPESICKETVSGPFGQSSDDSEIRFPYEVGAEEWKSDISGTLIKPAVRALFAKRNSSAAAFAKRNSSAATFVKLYFVLIAAAAAVLLIDRRSAHGTAHSKNHASMIFSPGQLHD